MTVVLLVKFMLFLINLSKCLAILCAGACVLFISGLIGIFGLCNFGSALSVGAFGLICLKYLMLSGDTMCFVLFRVLFICL